MKVSKYNYIFRTDEGNFAFNAVSDRFVRISDEVCQCLETGKVNSIKGDALDILLKRNVVVPDEIDEFQLLEEEYEKNLDSDIYDLVLLPTLDCNVRCWYCFEKQQKGSRLHKVISDSVLAHVKKVLEEKPYINRFLITLFGGEPMLHFREDVYPLLREIQQTIELEERTVRFVCITNGICLTKENIQLMKGMDSNFQISIDGYKKKHDAIKKIEGNPDVSSYDCVMANMALAVSELDSHINLRVNYDDNTLHHLTEIIDSIKNIPRNRITIHFERVWQTIERCSSNNEELKMVFRTFLKEGFNISYLNFFRRSHSCKASRINQISISYDGSIYKCTGRDFTLDLKEGILRTDGTVKWLPEKKEKRLSIKTYDLKQCRVCKLLPLCWGVCCQKQLESPSETEIAAKCQLNTMELSLDDYFYFRMKSRQSTIN